MVRKKYYLLVLSFALLFNACDNGVNNETFKGKTTRQWLAAADDRDELTRREAINALGNMTSPVAAKKVEDAALNADTTSIRVTALRFCYDRLPPDKLLATLDWIANRDSSVSVNNVLSDGYSLGVSKLRTAAVSLVPRLKELRTSTSKESEQWNIDYMLKEIRGQ